MSLYSHRFRAVEPRPKTDDSRRGTRDGAKGQGKRRRGRLRDVHNSRRILYLAGPVRVPLTKSPRLFFKAAEMGKQLIWLHTYGERMTDRDRPKGRVPKGQAKCTVAVSDTEAKYPAEFRFGRDTKTLGQLSLSTPPAPTSGMNPA